jgi:hypothetical protein
MGSLIESRDRINAEVSEVVSQVGEILLVCEFIISTAVVSLARQHRLAVRGWRDYFAPSIRKSRNNFSNSF